MLELHFDPGDIDREIKALAALVGVSVGDIVNDQMRLYCIDMIGRTPPVRGEVGGVKGKKNVGTMMGAKRVANRRVAKDISKLFVGLDQAGVAEARRMGAPFSGYYHHRSKTGAAWLVDTTEYRPDASHSVLRQHHQRQRSKTTGRTTSAGGGIEEGGFTGGDKRIGRWKSIDKMHVRRQELKKYIKWVQKNRIGRLKAGWLDGVRHFAGLVGGGEGRIPKWVKQHGTYEGAHGGRIDANGNGDIWAKNLVPYAGYKIRPSVIAAAHKVRQKDIIKNAAKRVDKIVEQFNGRGA